MRAGCVSLIVFLVVVVVGFTAISYGLARLAERIVRSAQNDAAD